MNDLEDIKKIRYDNLSYRIPTIILCNIIDLY